MEYKTPILLTICQGIILFLAVGVSSDPVVQLADSEIRGKDVAFEGNTVEQYLGIPYAEPPVGDLRFRKTVSLDSFPEQFDAFYQAPACRQFTETPFPWYLNDPYKSEDCLYLNIWKPDFASPDDPKPVMVFVHSGNWKFGSNSPDYYSGVPLCALNGIVVVTISYRLGVFGFLASDTDEAPGNAGLWDIKEALEWIHENIIYFGGNPSEITIAGQSSAATAVGYLTLKEDTQPLFSRMIMQSGSPVNFQTDYKKKNIELGKKMAKSLGCKEDDWDRFGPLTIQCLKNVPEDDMEYEEYKLGPNSTASFHPITGEEFLPENPRTSILKGNFQCKTLLIGNNRDEGSVILPLIATDSYGFFGDKDFQVTPDVVQKTLRILFKILPDLNTLSPLFDLAGATSPPALSAVTNNPLLNSVPNPMSAVTVPAPVSQLPAGLPDIVTPLLTNIIGDSSNPKCMRHQLHSAAGDLVSLCPTKNFAEKCAEQGNDVFYYFFVHRSGNSKFAPWMGATHFSELPYVFGIPLMGPDYTDDERKLSRRMVRYWGQFVKTGKPDPSWPKYTKDKPIYKVLDTKNGTKPYGKGPHQTNCGLLSPGYMVL